MIPPDMLAARLLRPGRFELRRDPVPEPAAGQILLRVDAALTCGTDLKMLRRGHPKLPMPAPMGHELSGTIVAIGPEVAGLAEGDAVALVPTAPCGRCRLCRRGHESLCPDAVGRVMLGAFAEYALVPAHIVERHVFPRPASLSPAEAAALEPLACVVHGASRLDLSGAESVVLIGDGAISLLFAQVALRQGAARVIVAGRHSQRLQMARHLGAEAIEVGREEDWPAQLADAVRDHTSGNGADVVVECVGTSASWEAAPSLATVGGEVLLFGGCASGARVSFDAYRLHYDEVDLKGAFHYGTPDVREALRLLAGGEVVAAPLITHAVPLPRLEEALDLALTREAIKVAITPTEAA